MFKGNMFDKTLKCDPHTQRIDKDDFADTKMCFF